MLLVCAQTLQDEAAAHFIGRTVWESVVAALKFAECDFFKYAQRLQL